MTRDDISSQVWEEVDPLAWRDPIYSEAAKTNCMGKLFAEEVDFFAKMPNAEGTVVIEVRCGTAKLFGDGQPKAHESAVHTRQPCRSARRFQAGICRIREEPRLSTIPARPNRWQTPTRNSAKSASLLPSNVLGSHGTKPRGSATDRTGAVEHATLNIIHGGANPNALRRRGATTHTNHSSTLVSRR